MKEKKQIENAKLGALVLAGSLFLVFTLYMIGRNQNIFGSSFTISSVVENVNGLVPGNNVRFKGIDVGTVKSVEMDTDSTILVTMYVRKKMKPYIRKNAITSISTDGLMGNKIIHILPQSGDSPEVEQGDILASKRQIDTEVVIEKLTASGDYLEKTIQNLYEITTKLNNSESLWTTLSDPTMAEDIRMAVKEVRVAGANASKMAQTGRRVLDDFEKGNGLVRRAFTDPVVADDFAASLEQLRNSSQKASELLKELQTMLQAVESGNGPVGLLYRDSLFRESLMKTMINLEEGTDNFNQNMEALKSNFLFRRYFKRIEKEKQKDQGQ